MKVDRMTMTNDIYGFIFAEQGLMAGLGVKGNKITRLAPQRNSLARRH